MLHISDEETLWFSATDPTRSYRVRRTERNIRGVLRLEFTCQCADREDNAARDCKHLFAEKLRLGLAVVVGTPKKERVQAVQAKRRPARKRKDHKGRPLRSTQRRARRQMPTRIPELALSLKKQFDKYPSGIVIPIRPQIAPRGKTITKHSTRALALLLKVASGESAATMWSEFERLIDKGVLPLAAPPCENTFSKWMNDERLTPVLHEYLRLTSAPFREREIGAIIDSSKISQMMTAHSRHVEYGTDTRYGADWMKCHALVDVETMVIMAVEFSGTRGNGTLDINLVKSLMRTARKTFDLEYLLGDKAYLKQDLLAWLWERNVRACIPLKKGWFRDGDAAYHEAVDHLVEWFDRNNNRDFHEMYRLRPKIEALFSLIKRMAERYRWSRGRSREVSNANEPCVAWMNELLCKFI